MKTNTFYTKKVLVALIAALLPLVASAQTKVEIDGIWYNLVPKAKQAEVTSGDTKYTGYINIPDTVTNEGVNYGVTSIGDWVFSDCKSLTSINIPESVTRIGNYTFNCCSGLTSINIPESVTRIGYGAFAGCSGLTAINIPENVTLIQYGTFQNCI